jgi:hypothetical protein
VEEDQRSPARVAALRVCEHPAVSKPYLTAVSLGSDVAGDRAHRPADRTASDIGAASASTSALRARYCRIEDVQIDRGQHPGAGRAVCHSIQVASSLDLSQRCFPLVQIAGVNALL